MTTIEQLLKNTDYGEGHLIDIAYGALGEENYGEFGIYKSYKSTIWLEVFLDDKGIITFKHNNQTVFQADY